MQRHIFVALYASLFVEVDQHQDHDEVVDDVLVAERIKLTRVE